jgi:hypothetical protein
VRHPSSSPVSKGEHVIGQHLKTAGDKRGAERGLAVPAATKECDPFPFDDDRRRVERLVSEGKQ